MPPDPRDRFDPGIDNGIDDEIQPGTVEVDGVQTENPDRLRERAAEGTPFQADDVELRDGEVRVRDSARRRVARRRAAAGTPFAPESFDVSDNGSVEAPDPTERVDVTVFDDGISGDVEIVNERTGERRDLGADAGGDEPFFGRIDAPDRQGAYRIEIGGETVDRFTVGSAGATVDRPGDLGFGFNGTILSADRGDTGVEQRDYDPDARRGTDEDVVAGAGASEALQAGADAERLSAANPISEQEGSRIAEALGQNDQQQQQRDIGGDMTDQQLATRGSAANRRLRERIASDREGLDASQVDLVATDDGLAFQRDGDTIGESDLDFGGTNPGGASPGPAAPSPAEAFDAAFRGGATRDSAPSTGETRAAVNRFGQRQLDQTEPSEQFGDIAFTNPLTGDRVEEDLTDAADEFRAFTSGATEFASRRDVPATGPFEPVGQAVAIDRLAGALTQEDVDGEGPTERFAEAGTVGFAEALNPPAAAAEAKEIGEFAATQPQRVGRAAASANDDSILPGVIGGAVDAGEGVARSEFARDVEQRTGRIIATASERARERPVSTAGGVAGGVVGGVAAGAAVGGAATRIPGVSGSDLSGRVLQAAARGGRGARRFVRDDRAQGNLLFGGGSDDAGGGDTVDLVDETALAEPDGEGQLARPPEGVSGASRDRQAAGLNQQGAFVGSNTNQQDAAFGGTGKPDTSGMDFSNVEFQELPRLQDRGETAGDAADVTGRSVNLDAIAAPGRRQAAGSSLAAALVAPALERQASAQSSSVFRGDAVFGEGIGADSRADVFGRADTGARVDALGGGRSDAFDDLFGRADTGARVNTRTGTGTRTDVDVFGRVDTRTDARQDVDTRQDTRTDTRTDTRFDTRLDTRQDTRTDFDPPFRFDTDRPPEDDDRRDDPGPFSLFGAERDFDSGIAGGETVADAVFGGEFALDATTERDLSADRTFRL